MGLGYRDIQIVKGMLERGDKQHDIASYFGVNGARIAEVATGNCDYPNAAPWPREKLPPPGPYVGAKSVFEITEILEEARDLINGAGASSDEAEIAVEAIETALGKLRREMAAQMK